MALNISSKAITEKNKLGSPYVWLLFVKLEVEGESDTFYVRDVADQTWAGETWIAYPFEVEPIKQSSDGKLATVSLRIANAKRALAGAMHDHDGLVGSTVTFYLVHSDNLGSSTPEWQATFTVKSSGMNSEWVSLRLGTKNVFETPFPRLRYIPNSCSHKFRDSRCKFSGADTDFTDSGDLVFDNSARTITRSDGGDWTTEGFKWRTVISVSGSESNDGNYEAFNVTSTVITIIDRTLYDETIDGTYTVTVKESCRHTLDDCERFSNETNYGGFPGAAEGWNLVR